MRTPDHQRPVEGREAKHTHVEQHQDHTLWDGKLNRRLVEPERFLELFEAIEPELYRYPAVDPADFRRAVEELVQP